MKLIHDNNSDAAEVLGLYESVFGKGAQIESLPGAGSDRRYFRLLCDGNPSVVATVGDNLQENKAFVGLSQAFGAHGISVPEIYGESGNCHSYLQQDLGDVSLLSQLDSDKRMELAGKSLKMLAKMQTVDESVWGGKVFSQPFSRRQAMWDLNYFKYEFIKPCALSCDEELLEDDFEKLAGRLADASVGLTGFMYRDFQSRNILVKNDVVWFIDFQGGRRGPMIYDAVSFLWQAKARFSEEERMELLECYADALCKRRRVEKAEVFENVDLFALFRTLQVLGAYGFRGLVEKKAHFIESIPDALSNLRALIYNGVADDYPELKKVCVDAVSSRYASVSSAEVLTVKVFSFSYKKGYPEDLSGNGGGFMFDCRGMHNPGRYDEYKPLTGMDSPVIEFLEKRGEVFGFVDGALALVEPSVATYFRRGFKSLQVGFGCTGGRHRSVYCAESFARKLAFAHPEIRVIVSHREQGIEREVAL